MLISSLPKTSPPQRVLSSKRLMAKASVAGKSSLSWQVVEIAPAAEEGIENEMKVATDLHQTANCETDKLKRECSGLLIKSALTTTKPKF